MPRKASKIALSQEEGEKLKRLICRETAQQREVLRAKIIPPENALVLSVDEKTSIQALGKKHPPQPMEPGKPKRVDHE